MKNPRNLQAQLKTTPPVPPLREANTRPIPIAIGINRTSKANPKEKLFLIPIAIGTNASKKYKTPDTQARQKSTRQMTQMVDIKMVVTHDRQERQPRTAPTINWRFSAPKTATLQVPKR